MNAARRVILLEFNELSPDLMKRFMAMGQLPNFQRLYDESHVYVTEAAERGWELNPWVQWVTVHSGLDYRDHGIIELDEGGKLNAKRVWDVVSESGFPVWVCGSMNVAYETPINGLVMPDPWTTKVPPFPDSLLPFFRFVQQNVLEHTTDRPALKRSDYLKFVVFMVMHGLSFSTVKAIVQQLLSERSGNHHWRRAVLLDKLQFDVFRWYYRKIRPRFSTFFSNSTAHFQHYHWREMEPHLFKVQPTEEKAATHEKTILFGYQQMDEMIGRFMALAAADTVLIFATALSQQPCLVYEDQGGKVTYRPKQISRLMKFADVTEAHTTAPLMAEVFNIHLKSEDDATSVQTKLEALQIEGRQAMQLLRKGTLITAKCQVHEKLPIEARISRKGGGDISFFDMFFELEDVKSGMHHPDGMLWIHLPEKAPRQHTEKVLLASVAPTILQLLSLPCPADMKAPPLAI
jgi:hypothetical protein